MGTPYPSVFICHITDTKDDDAVAKIKSAYALHAARAGILSPTVKVMYAPDATVIGTKVSELAHLRENQPNHTLIAVNYAPPDNKNGTQDNRRRNFWAADLGGKVSVCGTCKGLEFSYVKTRIQSFFNIADSNNGSQFRSWEVLPNRLIDFSAFGNRQQGIDSGRFVAVDDAASVVPDVPDITHVFQVDAPFQNVKLWPSKADLALLSRLAETRDPVSFAFGRSAIDVGGFTGVDDRETPLPLWHRTRRGLAAETMFVPPAGTNVIALNSSSTCTNGPVPMIATIRPHPTKTPPAYRVPDVGARVWVRNPGKPIFSGLRLFPGFRL